MWRWRGTSAAREECFFSQTPVRPAASGEAPGRSVASSAVPIHPGRFVFFHVRPFGPFEANMKFWGLGPKGPKSPNASDLGWIGLHVVDSDQIRST